MEVVHSRHISSFMEKKVQLACHKLANVHWSCLRGLNHPQGSSRYPFLLLFYIEDNVQFKFGAMNSRIQFFFFKNLTFVSPYLC